MARAGLLGDIPIFQHRPDLLFDIAADGDKPRPLHEHRARRLALGALDLAIPADLDQLSQAACIVLLALVHPNRHCRLRMAGVDTDDGQPNPLEFMPKPAGHGACLKANPLGMGCSLAKQLGQSTWIGFCSSLE